MNNDDSLEIEDKIRMAFGQKFGYFCLDNKKPH